MVDPGSLEDIKVEIEEIKASLPEHSIPPSIVNAIGRTRR